MISIPFIGGAYTHKSPDVNPEDTLNMFVEINPANKTPIALLNCPGLEEWLDIGESAEARQMEVMGDKLYYVVGDTVYEINSDKTYTKLGTLTQSSGHVFMANNGTQVIIVDGNKGYIIENSTLSEITDSDFPTPSSVTFQDGYFIVSKADSAEFYVSALYDGTNWDALDFATAEGYPDNLVRIMSFHRELWALGEESTEIWYNSGDVDFPFERLSGGVLEHGCIAPRSVAIIGERMLWLNDKRKVVATRGYAVEEVTPPVIADAFASYDVAYDAVGLHYRAYGHDFYMLIFPTERIAWELDLTTGFWHRRESYEEFNSNRPRAQAIVRFNEQYICGDYLNGKLWLISEDVVTENGHQIKRQRTTRNIVVDGVRFFIDKLEIDFEGGVGTPVGQGEDPVAMLQWSVDGGHTWSNEHWEKIGKLGEYSRRAIWRRLGSSYKRAFRLTITDPVKVVITDARASIRKGVS